MTRQDAIEYDNWLKSGLMQEAEVLGLGEKAGSDLADRYITVIPDDERKGMVFLGEEAASYKLGNVRLDLKKAIVAALELAASVSLPESLFNYLQLLIVGAFFIQKSTKQEIGKNEAYILYFLHQKNCYERGIDEEDFQDEFKIWCEEKMESCPDGVKCKKALRTLRKYKVIDIEDGKIYLRERVIGYVE